MPATPIAASTPYINPGTTKIVFATTVSNKSTPTRGEINAGTDLTREVTATEGWTTSSNQVESPDLDTRFTSTIPGRITAEDSSLTFRADLTGSDARSLMPRDTNGYIMIFDGGDVAGRKMRVFPVRVASVGMPISAEGSEPATVVIQYAITSEPAENVTVPA
jgi:hypothetical protein